MAEMALVRTTVGTRKAAVAAARRASRLAACVHVAPLESWYTWEGRLRNEKEWLVEARVLKGRVRATQRVLLQGHPYALPLLETVPTRVSAEYHRWARSLG